MSVLIMMFRRVNKQPGIQKFWNWCSRYQEIYYWISPLNKRSGSPVTIYSNTVVYGGKWVWWIWSLVYFHSFEALNDAFEVQFFSGLHFYTLPKTLTAYMYRAMQLRFFKVKTLLNNSLRLWHGQVLINPAQYQWVQVTQKAFPISKHGKGWRKSKLLFSTSVLLPDPQDPFIIIAWYPTGI